MRIENLNKPIRIGLKTAPNRIVYQPSESNNADNEGSVTEATLKRYRKCAEGKPGILYVESLDVTRSTQARTNRLLIMDENRKDLARLVEEIRTINEKSLIIFQLSHAGRLSDPQLKPPVYVYDTGDPDGHVLTTEEVAATKQEFVRAACIAREVGADGVDVKHAHGFICDDFLHPANQRNDQYGGSFENRTRFFRETISEIRDAIKDKSFIIGTRISPYEGIPGGCGTSGPDELLEDLTEMLSFARMIEEEGLSFINVSAGFANANLEILMPTDTYPEGVFRLFSWTRTIKEAVEVPVIGSGYSYLSDGENNIFANDKEKRSLLYWAEKNIEQGHTDLIGIGRQAIADPLFAHKVVSGELDDINYCTACNGCGILLVNQHKVGCIVYDEEYKKLYARLGL